MSYSPFTIDGDFLYQVVDGVYYYEVTHSDPMIIKTTDSWLSIKNKLHKICYENSTITIRLVEQTDSAIATYTWLVG